MSILIKGMVMPKSCFYCPFREKVDPDTCTCMALNKEFEETFSLILGKRHKDCPLVEVPTPHGDLIDADEELRLMQSCEYDTYDDYSRAFDMLDCAPTVIEAEGE